MGLRLLSDRRDDLAEERARTVNRLHALLRDLIAGGAKRNLTTPQAAALLRTVRPMTPADEHRKSLARDLLADAMKTSHAPNLSSCLLGWVVVGGGEGDLFVEMLSGVQAVV
ncbi:MAG: IS110 family transposase, partial [Actinobacteria bacterium]|nr:IS110 family transposase [Actinomycetota bacterium]